MSSDSSDDQVIISVSEAARRLGISRELAGLLARESALPGLADPPKVGRFWRVDAGVLEAWLDAPASRSAVIACFRRFDQPRAGEVASVTAH